MEMVRDVLGPSRSAPSACFGLGREAAGSIFKKDPEFETFVESMVQVLTVSEADGINRAGIRGANDVLLGVKAGLWGSDATNTASNVFPGFIVARKQRGDDRVVGRTAFVKIPRSTVTLPKESVAALMELVETRMQADKLVIVVERLEDDEALRKAWVRAFTMIGFEMVSAAAMPHNSDKYMLLGCEF